MLPGVWMNHWMNRCWREARNLSTLLCLGLCWFHSKINQNDPKNAFVFGFFHVSGCKPTTHTCAHTPHTHLKLRQRKKILHGNIYVMDTIQTFQYMQVAPTQTCRLSQSLWPSRKLISGWRIIFVCLNWMCLDPKHVYFKWNMALISLIYSHAFLNWFSSLHTEQRCLI